MDVSLSFLGLEPSERGGDRALRDPTAARLSAPSLFLKYETAAITLLSLILAREPTVNGSAAMKKHDLFTLTA